MTFWVLLWLIVQLVLVGPLFLVQQYRWKAHMMEAIKAHSDQFSVEELSMTKKEFSQINWRDEKKEFVFQGRFYDVFQIKSYGDKVVIQCVKDGEESRLIEQYIASGKGEKNPLHHGLKMLWSNLTLEEIFIEAFVFHRGQIPLENPCYSYAFAVKASCCDTPAPPPNFG